jgi:flagellar hook assembly protein FlgD
MKTSIKILALTFAFFAAVFTANADDRDAAKPTGFATGIYTTKSGKINVNVEKMNAAVPITLALKNERGEVIYRETVGKNHQRFGRTLNVSELPAGKYEIHISSKIEKMVKHFEVSEQKTERSLAIN